MCSDPNGLDRINSYAIVSYIPEPLAGYLDLLRQEVVPYHFLPPHTTIPPPPPRAPISATRRTSGTESCFLARRFSPFKIELTGVEVFAVSAVIYIAVGA